MSFKTFILLSLFVLVAPKSDLFLDDNVMTYFKSLLQVLKNSGKVDFVGCEDPIHSYDKSVPTSVAEIIRSESPTPSKNAKVSKNSDQIKLVDENGKEFTVQRVSKQISTTALIILGITCIFIFSLCFFSIHVIADLLYCIFDLHSS